MYEQEVARMEREEEELMNKLKQTKSLEDQANQVLQKAYTDPNVVNRQPQPSASRKSMQGSSKKGF